MSTGKREYFVIRKLEWESSSSFPLYLQSGVRGVFLLLDSIEVHAPFKLLWTPAGLGVGETFCYFHVTSSDGEVRKLSLPLGCNESPCCPLGLFWHHLGQGKGSAFLQPADVGNLRLLSQTSMMRVLARQQKATVFFVLFFPVMFGCSI